MAYENGYAIDTILIRGGKMVKFTEEMCCCFIEVIICIGGIMLLHKIFDLIVGMAV